MMNLFRYSTESTAGRRSAPAGTVEGTARDIMGEHAWLAQRCTLRRRHERIAEEMPGRHRSSADQRGGVNQAKRCISRKVPD